MLESEYLDCPFKLIMTVEPMHCFFGFYFITMFMWQHVDGKMLKARLDHGPQAVLNIGPEQAFMHI